MICTADEPVTEFVDTGVLITATGGNKCQCGLSFRCIGTSCRFGYLHHLVADDGKTCNFLQFVGCRFKGVEIQAKKFPDNFLLVESVTIKQSGPA